MRNIVATIGLVSVLAACAMTPEDAAVVDACQQLARDGLRELARDRAHRFQGKVEEYRARCRGGETAVADQDGPWVDWSNYWATGDGSSRSVRRASGSHLLNRNLRGIDGALIDLEYQRMELIKFNLFDNKTYHAYLGSESLDGATLKVWPEMRLPPDHPQRAQVRTETDGNQLCWGSLIRHRTMTGICNDIRNPAMGSTGQLFARNVEFESTFPDLGGDEYTKNRHGGRISLLSPDPQVISRKLFTRTQENPQSCNEGKGAGADVLSDCSYAKAPFFNVLAAFWIQFMTHDWFSHLEEARNDQSRMLTDLGCRKARIDNVETPLTPEESARLGCRNDDKIDAAFVADNNPAPTIRHNGQDRLARAHKTSRNNVTAWWDASQIYGFDQRSIQRVRRDPADSAKLLMEKPMNKAGDGDQQGYLPVFRAACGSTAGTSCDPINVEWVGQESAAFPDSWSIGLSFLHNVFVREHNLIIDAFRKIAREQPQTDSGLRNPDRPTEPIAYGQISDEELFEIARLIVAAEIAKIHTIEWTTQLLYNEPLNLGMNSNWSGLFNEQPRIADIVERIVVERLATSPDSRDSNLLYSALAAGPGIVGLGSHRYPSAMHRALGLDEWSLENPDHVNGGINHFGSPFNFPEEFVTVYRLHPLVPDVIEFRELGNDPNKIRQTVPVIDTFRGKATDAMRSRGLSNWAVSMGRQRLGQLSLQNHPLFLQNLDLRPRLDTKIDVAALDLIRDRERGVPRFNEFRRQIGLRQLTSFDDFVDRRLPARSPEIDKQRRLVIALREVYGQHLCDESKIITSAQLDQRGQMINDCLGRPNGTMIDNVEDLDVVVGFLAEMTRPHGFAISETQFHIFILNASRRLFSDRFFTSSFRPEFYTHLGLAWVMDNGPTGPQWEAGEPNGHRQHVLPFKRVLLRTMPELEPELQHVVNAFDPWSRDRGTYYTLEWKPRSDAVTDDAFRPR